MESIIQFSQALAANERRLRDVAVDRLRIFLKIRSASSETMLTEDDMMKMWKGLFYSLWMSDKPLVQEELSNTISNLIHCMRNKEASLLFIKAGFKTIFREYSGLDQWRLDKYLIFIRKFLRQCFMLVKYNKWDDGVIEDFIEILSQDALSSKCCSDGGLQLHLADIYIEELVRVAGPKISGEKLTAFFKPFCYILVESKFGKLHKRIMHHVFDFAIRLHDITDDDADASTVDDDNDSDDDDQLDHAEASEDFGDLNVEEKWKKTIHEHEVKSMSVPQFNFDYKGIGDMLLSILSNTLTSKKVASMIYRQVNRLHTIAKKVYPLDIVISDVDDDFDLCTETLWKAHEARKKRFSKRKLSIKTAKMEKVERYKNMKREARKEMAQEKVLNKRKKKLNRKSKKKKLDENEGVENTHVAILEKRRLPLVEKKKVTEESHKLLRTKKIAKRKVCKAKRNTWIIEDMPLSKPNIVESVKGVDSNIDEVQFLQVTSDEQHLREDRTNSSLSQPEIKDNAGNIKCVKDDKETSNIPKKELLFVQSNSSEINAVSNASLNKSFVEKGDLSLHTMIRVSSKTPVTPTESSKNLGKSSSLEERTDVERISTNNSEVLSLDKEVAGIDHCVKEIGTTGSRNESCVIVVEEQSEPCMDTVGKLEERTILKENINQNPDVLSERRSTSEENVINTEVVCDSKVNRERYEYKEQELFLDKRCVEGDVQLNKQDSDQGEEILLEKDTLNQPVEDTMECEITFEQENKRKQLIDANTLFKEVLSKTDLNCQGMDAVAEDIDNELKELNDDEDMQSVQDKANEQENKDLEQGLIADGQDDDIIILFDCNPKRNSSLQETSSLCSEKELISELGIKRTERIAEFFEEIPSSQTDTIPGTADNLCNFDLRKKTGRKCTVTLLKQSPDSKGIFTRAKARAKRVGFQLDKNTDQQINDYQLRVRSSPTIPFDACKIPKQGVLKQHTLPAQDLLSKESKANVSKVKKSTATSEVSTRVLRSRSTAMNFF